MSVENGRSGVTLQARASHFVRKIFGGRKLANDRQSASRTGPIIISRYRASSMDIPRKPFVSPSQPALSLPLRPDMYSEGSSNTSISTNALSEQPIITHKKGASTPAMDIPRPAPSVQFSLPGIIVTHHPSTPPATRGNGLPVTPPESGPQSNASREAIETLVPLQARSPTLRPFSPSSLPAAFEGMNSFGIPSGLISPMALDPSAAQTPPLARSTSAATSDPAYALTSAPLPTEPVVQSRRSSAPQLPSFPPAFASTTPSSTRVDKQGHSLRLSPAIIQRVPPWPIKNLPSISLYGISNSNSGPAARKPPPARRMTLDVYLEPSPSSSQRRPSPSRLSTMPTLSMNGRSHERQTTERESPDHELGQDMEDDEIEEIGAQGRDFRAVVQGHFGRASMESTRSADGDESDSARTERGPGRTEEIVGRPSMDSIDEDGRWTPTPSPSPSTSTFPERWQMPFASPSAQVKDTFTKGPISLGSAFGWGGTSAFAPASGMGATTSPNAGPSFHATSAEAGAGYFSFQPHHQPNGNGSAGMRTPTLASVGYGSGSGGVYGTGVAHGPITPTLGPGPTLTPRPHDLGPPSAFTALPPNSEGGSSYPRALGAGTARSLLPTSATTSETGMGLPALSLGMPSDVDGSRSHEEGQTQLPLSNSLSLSREDANANTHAQEAVFHGVFGAGTLVLPGHRIRGGGLDVVSASENKMYRRPSRSMIDLSSIAAPPSPPYEDTGKGKGRAREPNITLEQQIQNQGNVSPRGKTVKRRQSMPSMATQPPAYQPLPVVGAEVMPRDEEGRERLPGYHNDIVLVAEMPRKMEFTQPGVISHDRKWRRVVCVLEGTKFTVYKVRGVKSVWEGVLGAGDTTVYRSGSDGRMYGIRAREEEEDAADAGRVRKVQEESLVIEEARTPTSPSSPTFLAPRSHSRSNSQGGSSPALSRYSSNSNVSSPSSTEARGSGRRPVSERPLSSASCKSIELERPDPSLLVREYTLQHAESGLATDYLKRRNVVRVRMEGEQFLLQAKDIEDVVEWIEALQAAANVALDLDERAMPRGPLFPRRRRRRRRVAEETA